MAGAFLLVPLTLALSQRERGLAFGSRPDFYDNEGTVVTFGFAQARAKPPLFFLEWLCSTKWKEA